MKLHKNIKIIYKIEFFFNNCIKKKYNFVLQDRFKKN